MKTLKLMAILAIFTTMNMLAVVSPDARLACLCDDNSLIVSHDPANLDANWGNNRWCTMQCGSKGFSRGDVAKGDYYGFLDLEAIVSGMSTAQLKEQIAQNGLNEASVGSGGRLKEVLKKELGTNASSI